MLTRAGVDVKQIGGGGGGGGVGGGRWLRAEVGVDSLATLVGRASVSSLDR